MTDNGTTKTVKCKLCRGTYVLSTRGKVGYLEIKKMLIFIVTDTKSLI